MSQKRRKYTSEISRGQWKRIAWILPEKKGAGRPQELAMYWIFNAILDVLVNGNHWRNIPNDYPNPHSVYYHYRKWCKDGTLARLNRALRYLDRQRAGRCPHPSAGIIS